MTRRYYKPQKYHTPTVMDYFLHSSQAEQADPKEHEKASAIKKVLKNERLFARLQAAANARDLDLDEVISESIIDGILDEDPRAKNTKQKYTEMALNARGGETGEYDHVAPQKHEVQMSGKVPTNIDGFSIEELAAVLTMPLEEFGERVKLVECEVVDDE